VNYISIIINVARCADYSSFLIAPDSEFTLQSASPNWVKLPEKEGMSVENHFPVTKYINIKLCKEVI
jgi:hypothetical protein